MKDIYFYSRKKEYGWLSNFWRADQYIDGFRYATNEHYYQSEKAKNYEMKKWISNAPTPYAAMKAGRSLRDHEMVDDWDSKKFIIMKKGLLVKFYQNVELRWKLFDTENAKLHEDSPTDMVWGKKGRDMLGKLLMEVREELRNGLQ